MSEKAKIGILSFAHVHAPAYTEAVMSSEDAELVGIYDSREYRGTRAAANFGGEYFQSVDRLLQKTQGTIVTSENNLHADFVQRAASTGNHVLCEKPISIDPKDADRMIESCKANNVNLYIAFPMRYNPPVRSLKLHVENDEVGDILGISSTNHGSLPPGWFLSKKQAGGGSIIDHTVHLVDLFRWIFQLEIKELYSRMGTLLHDIDVEDCGLTTLTFRDGSFATIDASWSRPESFPTWGDLNMRIYGTDGIIELKAFDQKIELYLDQNTSAVWENWGTDSNFEMISDFIRSISEKDYQPELATGEDGKKALQTALASYRSAEKGGPVKMK